MFGFRLRKQKSDRASRMVGNPYGFIPGCAYVANSTPKCLQQQIIVMAGGRDSGGRMTFVRVGGIASGQIRTFDGHETALLRFDDGGEYFVSAAVMADVDEASRVLRMIRKK